MSLSFLKTQLCMTCTVSGFLLNWSYSTSFLLLFSFLEYQSWMSTSDLLPVLNRSKQKLIAFPSLFFKVTHGYLLQTRCIYQLARMNNRSFPFPISRNSIMNVFVGGCTCIKSILLEAMLFQCWNPVAGSWICLNYQVRVLNWLC